MSFVGTAAPGDYFGVGTYPGDLHRDGRLWKHCCKQLLGVGNR